MLNIPDEQKYQTMERCNDFDGGKKINIIADEENKYRQTSDYLLPTGIGIPP